MWEKTVTLLPGNRLRSKPRREVVIDIITAFEPCHVDSVQFGYDNIRVAFETPQGRTEALKKPSIEVCKEKIKIDGGGAPILTVVLFDYPFEGLMEPVIEALGDFGDFKSFRFQKYPYEDMDIYTGSRLIRMTLHEEVDELPRYITISGYYCRLWHRGQTIRCNICNEGGHKAASCPYKGKCLRCKGEGHIARNCPIRDRAFVDAQDPPVGVPPSEDPVQGVQNEVQNEVQNINVVHNEAQKGVQEEVQNVVQDVQNVGHNADTIPNLVENCDPAAELGSASVTDSVLLNADPQNSVVTDDSLDTRDNELSEFSELSQSILSGMGVAHDGDSVPDSLVDVDMGTVNPRKRSLSEGSSSGSAPPDGAGAVSYASVVRVQISPPPSQRRRRITPAVNVERSRSRSVSHGSISDSVESLVSPNNA